MLLEELACAAVATHAHDLASPASSSAPQKLSDSDASLSVTSCQQARSTANLQTTRRWVHLQLILCPGVQSGGPAGAQSLRPILRQVQALGKRRRSACSCPRAAHTQECRNSRRRAAPDKAQVHAQAAVHARASEADVDTIRYGRPGWILRWAIKADLPEQQPSGVSSCWEEPMNYAGRSCRATSRPARTGQPDRGRQLPSATATGLRLLTPRLAAEHWRCVPLRFDCRTRKFA